jgi:hypothetical protein
LGPQKKFLLQVFFDHLLINICVEFVFSYAVFPHHNGVERDTIKVARGTSTKLLHYKGHVLIYPMENEMPFIHHIVEWWGCSFIIKDGKG